MNPNLRTHTIRFIDCDSAIEAPEGETVLQSARRAGVRIVGQCSGRGVCDNCAMTVVSGTVVSVLEHAGEAAPARPAPEWVRACQVTPTSDCQVKIEPRALAQRAGIVVKEGHSVIACALKPVVKRYQATLVPASLGDTAADMDRLSGVMGSRTITRSDITALRQLSPLLRAHDWRLGVIVRDGECIGCRPAESPLLGLAVDFGSTNAAAFLVDLESGQSLAHLVIENPQGIYGSDVITRINHAVRTDNGSAELKTASVAALETFVREFCAVVAATPEDIVDVALCGNTAMHHLLLGLPVAQLGRAPFVPAVTAALDIKARDIGLHILEGAYIHTLPNVGGFVGGDHVAALLASESLWSPVATSLVMDIGTNTELSLIHHGEIRTASTASGPALEGGHISAGMRAAEGAIERVWLNDEGIGLQVIGGGEPVGLCGSGVIGTLAALIQAGIVDKRGSIRPDQRHVRKKAGQAEVELAPNVAFTQADVRAVQLAKAAIRAGIDMLLREAGLEEEDLDCLVIAGTFGTVIDIPQAITIGMLPLLPLDRFHQVGNAAGDGARMALVSADVREQATELARRCRHLELNTLQGFQKSFMNRIGFDMNSTTAVKGKSA